jgi:hypothetical protein
MKEVEDHYEEADRWESQPPPTLNFFAQAVRLMEALTWYVAFGYCVHAHGWQVGPPAYFLSVYVLYCLLYGLFAMERLSAAERFFHKEDPRQGSNIVTFVKMDRV